MTKTQPTNGNKTMKNEIIFEWTVGNVLSGAKFYKVVKRASGSVQVWLYGAAALNQAEPMMCGTIEDARAFWKANH